MKYQIGDKVKVRSDLSRKFYGAHIAISEMVDGMKGKSATITEVLSHGYRIAEFKFVWTDEMFLGFASPDRYELHITCNDGKTTNAVYKVNGKIEKRAEAVCAPSDTFSFNAGAELAINRVLYGTDYNPKDVAFKTAQPIAPQEDKPKFKVGQRVKVIGSTCNGEIGTITKIDEKAIRDDFAPYGVQISNEWTWKCAENIEPYTEPSLTVTREMLVELGACSSGLAEFDKKFPSGKGEFEEVRKATDVSNSCWLHNHRFSISTMQNEQPKSKYESMSNDELKRLACGISELCCPTLSNKKRKSDCPFFHTQCEVTNENRSEIIQYLIDEDTPEPEKEPEPVYYNGKVVCVDNGGYSDLYTAGKIYAFKDGQMTNDEGYRSNSSYKCKDFSELEANFSAKFIPYLGEA